MNEAVQVLQQLADKIGATGGALFQEYVWLTVIDGCMSIGLGVIGLVVVAMATAWANRNEAREDASDGAFDVAIIVTISSVVISIFCVAAIYNGALAVIAPQGVAVREIMRGKP